MPDDRGFRNLVPFAVFVRRNRLLQNFFVRIVEPDASLLVTAAAFVVDTAGVFVVRRDFALISEDAVVVFTNRAAELNAGVARDLAFEIALENEVAKRLFIKEERIVRRIRNAFADDAAVLDFVRGGSAVLGPAAAVKILAVKKGNKTFLAVGRLDRSDGEATERRKENCDRANCLSHSFNSCTRVDSDLARTNKTITNFP